VNFWVGDSYCVGVASSTSRTGLNSPDKPTQTGIIGTCNKYYDVVAGDTCSAIEQSFGITHGQFLIWNVGLHCIISSTCPLIILKSLLFLVIAPRTFGLEIPTVLELAAYQLSLEQQFPPLTNQPRLVQFPIATNGMM